MGGEESSRRQKHRSNKSFVIREVAINRTRSDNGAEWSRGKSLSEMEKAMMMDYDTPELVVFLQEDRAKDGCVMEECECREEAMKSSSSVSKASDCACRHPRTNKCGFRNLMVMVEGDRPTEVSGEEEEALGGLDRKQHGERCWCGGMATSTTCATVAASHGSGDSISSTHSFTFPTLQREWSGSPVRMAEAHSSSSSSSSSRRLRWRNILCPCSTC